jgi:hypothetical protein
MPFPLAHPAAVLPLRRFCPHRLSLPALMLGSLAPDTSYLLGRFHGSEFAHTLLGSFGFCLPAGLLLFLVFQAIREPLANALPAPHRHALVPLCGRPAARASIVLGSLLLGIWSHLVLDAVTRESRLVVAHLPLFQDELASIQSQGVQPYRILWYAFTGLGLAWLGLAYLRFLKQSTGSMRCWVGWDLERYLAWACLLIFPGLVVLPFTLRYAEGWPQVYAVRQFFYFWSAYYLVATGITLAALGVGLRVRALLRQPVSANTGVRRGKS